MSETPRTDAARQDEHDPYMAVASECTKLEKELAAASNRIKRLEAVTNDPHALWTNWLRGDVKLPVGIGDVRQYQERIKRLEELGNELRECARQLGWTSSDDSRWIERAESAVKAWDKEAKL